MKLISLLLPLVLARSRVSDQAREMVCRVNLYRKRHGMPPVFLDRRLMVAAQRHSQDQAAHHRMSHRGSHGTYFEQRARRAGYPTASGAENVAWGQRSVQKVMAAWIHSPLHRANLVSRNRCFGYGEVNTYWTQVFGSGDQCTDRHLPNCSDFH